MKSKKIKHCPCGHPVAWHDGDGCTYGRGHPQGGCPCARARRSAASPNGLGADGDLLVAIGSAIAGLEQLRDVLVSRVGREPVLPTWDAPVATGLRAVDLRPEAFQTLAEVNAVLGDAAVKPKRVAAPSRVKPAAARTDLGPAKLGGGELRILAALRPRSR